MIQLIENGAIFTGEALLPEHCLLVEEGRIAALLPASEAPRDPAHRHDLDGGTLIPGFIDLQVNGGGGALFNDAPTVETLRTIGEAHRRFGTCGFLPTLISDCPQVMTRAIGAVAQAMAGAVPGVLGIHLEGPLLNPQRRGIHDAAHFATLDAGLADLLCSLQQGVTLLTLAPERVDARQLTELARRGVILAAGHTEATYEEVCIAQDAGLSGFTHLFNAMSPLQSRAPGAVGAALSREHGWFGIIADGQHVHPAAVRIAIRSREPGAAVLVTDAMPTVGGSQSSFELAGQQIDLREGRLQNAAGTLAGSHLDMLSAVNNAAAFAGIDWYEAVRMASLYPARALGLEGELGRIAPGYRANLLALDSARHISASWIDGAPLCRG